MFMVKIKGTSHGFTRLLYDACQCRWKVPDTPHTLYSKTNLLKESRKILFFRLFKLSVTQMRMLFASGLFILLSTKKHTAVKTYNHCPTEIQQGSPGTVWENWLNFI